MDLHTAGHRRGVVCAPHHAAAEAGRAILAEGGNALEAMVAMAATIAVVYPHMNHIGGDGFWLVREPSGKVRALMAAGAPAHARRRSSIASRRRIPTRGPLAALTVPGAVGGWMLALEAAKAHGGRCRSPICSPRPSASRAKARRSRAPARLTAEARRALKDVPGFAADLPDRRQAAGRRRAAAAPALAATLDQLAHTGLDDFYRGDVGREIAADLERVGSPVTRADLERCHAYVARAALGHAPGRHAVQYAATDAGSRLADDSRALRPARVNEAESFDHVHGLIEATKRAFRVRDRVITDPARLPHSLDRYLSEAFLGAEARSDRPPQGGRLASAARSGDTIWMGAADASGLVVSYIQSLYWEFGSGVVLPRTGIVMQNRGSSFSLDRAALNALEPGRLPPHTLNPALAVLRDGRVMAYGTMGGDAPAADPGGPVHPLRALSPAARPGDRPPALVRRPDLGLGARQSDDRGAVRRQPHRPALSAGHDVDVTGAYSDRWAMPARLCCIRTAPWKAPTTRAPTAEQPGYKISASQPSDSLRRKGLHSAPLHAMVRHDQTDLSASSWPRFAGLLVGAAPARRTRMSG